MLIEALSSGDSHARRMMVATHRCPPGDPLQSNEGVFPATKCDETGRQSNLPFGASLPFELP